MTLKTTKELIDSGLINEKDRAAIEDIAVEYQISVTDQLVDTMVDKTANDPVYAQYVPSSLESYITNEELQDPIGDKNHEVTKGLIHRYNDRALFKITHACAVYCRFCFRREMVGHTEESVNDEDISNAISYIKDHPEIMEVILSGGDPFVLSPRRIKNLMEALSDIEHVKVIRFHTRVPVVDPACITEGFCDALKSDKTVIVSIHTNHAQELNEEAKDAIKKLNRAGVMLISQTVLLKGVNDNVDALDGLFRQLMEIGVKPYNLHHPDKAKGTSHFRLTIKEGIALHAALRCQISGPCLPQYVLDIPGGFGKVPVNSDWVKQQEDGSYLVVDIYGDDHVYWD